MLVDSDCSDARCWFHRSAGQVGGQHLRRLSASARRLGHFQRVRGALRPAHEALDGPPITVGYGRHR